MDQVTDVPVRTEIRVNAPVSRAFAVFTEEFDTWWPREHHIGKSPLKRAVIEGKAGGRCFNEQMDGTDCDWGTVMVWDPPKRFVLAWQISPTWQYEPDLDHASEVEVRFTPDGDGTRVELEHRYFMRHGSGGAMIRKAVEAPSGWAGLLQLFARTADAGAAR